MANEINETVETKKGLVTKVKEAVLGHKNEILIGTGLAALAAVGGFALVKSGKLNKTEKLVEMPLEALEAAVETVA